MAEELQLHPVEKQLKETITSTIYCVNTNVAYIYELLNGDIVKMEKVFMKV